MKNMLAVCAVAFLPAAAAAQWDSDRYTSPRNATVDAKGATLVEVTARAGSLEIEGVSGITEVRVKGTAKSNREEHLDEIKLKAERRGSRVVVIVDIPDQNNWGFNMVNRALDLVIQVPKGMALDVDDSSGDMEIRHVGALKVDDSSGEIELEDIGGELNVDDSSGEIRIDGVKGDIRVDDSSGNIDIRNVTGRVTIEDDSSGDIDINDITGSVEIENDSSGDIEVRRVSGDFTVGHDGSGGVRYSSVKGEVKVPLSRSERRRRSRDS